MRLQLTTSPPLSGVEPLLGGHATPRPAPLPPGVEEQIRGLGEQITSLTQRQHDLESAAGLTQKIADTASSRLEIFHGYMIVLAVAFVVTLLLTPIMGRLAAANGVLDRPSDPRKIHRAPVPYLGGVAVFLGIFGGILVSYLALAFPSLIDFHPSTHLEMGLRHQPVPLSILLGIFIIMLVGLLDDVTGISPRIKVAGQLIAAAALAYQDVGVKVAAGVLQPTLGVLLHNHDLRFDIPLGMDLPLLGSSIQLDVIYWTGTAVIAVFVLGACNASNLIDGLDGLLAGTTAIANIGLLIVALGMALGDDGPRDAQRIILCLSVLGACLGFLPHNFNPATIFLGDAGSLMLGFCTIVVVLTLGDTGRTDLVLAGLIIYAIPIIDTVLAIVRRKLAGKSISDPDSNHLHHMLKRALGVKGAVLTLYGIGAIFAALGVWMASGRARVTYTLAIIFAAYIAVTAIKIARKADTDKFVLEIDQRRAERAAQRAAEDSKRRPSPTRSRSGKRPAPRPGAKRPDPKPSPAQPPAPPTTTGTPRVTDQPSAQVTAENG